MYITMDTLMVRMSEMLNLKHTTFMKTQILLCKPQQVAGLATEATIIVASSTLSDPSIILGLEILAEVRCTIVPIAFHSSPITENTVTACEAPPSCILIRCFHRMAVQTIRGFRLEINTSYSRTSLRERPLIFD